MAKKAATFEQKAIDLYMSNADSYNGEQRDPWVEKSVQQLAELQDGR